MNIYNKFKLDKTLIIYLIIFMIISMLTIYSAMTYLPKYLGNIAIKQGMWYLVGFLFIFLIIKFKNELFFKQAWFIYFGFCFLLLLLLFIGVDINGSKCWFIIPKVGSIQPSEFMKIGIILLSSIVTGNFTKNKNHNIKEELIYLSKMFGIFIVPSILTFLEPDTGSVLIYAIIIFINILFSNLRKRYIITLLMILIVSLSIFFYLYIFQEELFIKIVGESIFYRIHRILDWKNGTGFQLENSLTSVISSGLIGHGYNKTPIYFPESGTDFIFSVYSSNFGLIGSFLLLILITLFDLHLIDIARNCKNTINKYVIISTTSMFIFGQIQNISMTLGLLPIMGIPLPFISYGGSSLLSYMILIGIILNIYSEEKHRP